MLGLKSKAVYCSWMNLTMLKLLVQVRLTFYVWILLSDGLQAVPTDGKRCKQQIQWNSIEIIYLLLVSTKKVFTSVKTATSARGFFKKVLVKA